MKVLNFGSLNIDRSYSVAHFVRSGETLSSLEMKTASGGKGLNQSIALSRAGLSVWHAGKIGSDGEFLLKELAESGVDISLISRDGTLPTGHAIIQVDTNGQNCILLHGGSNRAITHEEIDAVLSNFGPGDWLFLQNEISCLQYLIQQGHAKEMTVVLNPSPLDEELLQMDLDGVSWLILNEIEGEGLTGLHEPTAICAALQEKYPGVQVVLTLGSEGSLCYDGTNIVRQAIFPTTSVDSTAAGDTFTGYFFAAVISGSSKEEALKQASMAASISVSRCGAAPSIPAKQEVITALQNICE